MFSVAESPVFGHLADSETVTYYRWDPSYTSSNIGNEPLFRPTGGELVFRMAPSRGSAIRRVLGNNYKDVITLKEVRAALLGDSVATQAADIYRPPLCAPNSGRVRPERIARNLVPFGITSISKCTKWSSNMMAAAQPVLIYGAVPCDKSDYTKYDALRLPADLCEIDEATDKNNVRGYLYLTLKRVRENWDVKFVFTPAATYRNETMLEEEGFSLVYKLGLVDYMNMGPAATNVFRARSVMDKEHEDTKWYFEGFVYYPHSSWELYYEKAPLDFYEGFAANSDERFKDLIVLDRGRKTLLKYFTSAMKREDEEEEDDDEEEQTEVVVGSKRQRPTNAVPHKKRKSRFTGGGVSLGCGGMFRSAFNAGARGASKRAAIPQIRHKGLPRYTRLGENGRDYNSRTAPTTNSKSFQVSLDVNLPYREIGKGLYKDMMKSVAPNFELNKRLATSITNAMTRKSKIRLRHLEGNGAAITVSARDAFLIIGMAFMGQLRIERGSVKDAINKKTLTFIKKQMNLDDLFTRANLAKLRCVANYLYICLSEPEVMSDSRKITFVHYGGVPSVDPLMNMPVVEPMAVLRGGEGIEDVPGGIMSDFANVRFGGSVTSSGSVQEEIQIMMHPEMLLGRLLFGQMKPASSLRILGALRFNNYSGYGRSSQSNRAPFEFTVSTKGIATASKARDSEGRSLIEVTAFDAISFKRKPDTQYTHKSIAKELEKAISAFAPLPNTDTTVPVVTGRWGAGEFKGDPILKSLIQVAAGSAVGRPLIFVKMDEDDLVAAVRKISADATQAQLTVGQFMTTLVDRVYAKGCKLTIDNVVQAFGAGIQNLLAQSRDNLSVRSSPVALVSSDEGEEEGEEEGEGPDSDLKSIMEGYM